MTSLHLTRPASTLPLSSSGPHCRPATLLPPPLAPRSCRDGSIYAYAVSYDWSRGYSEHNPATAKNYIYLHAPQEAEVKSRNRPPGTRR